MTNRKTIRQAIATTLILTVSSFSTALFSIASAQVTPKFQAELMVVKGAATLNGIAVTSGATLYQESRIVVGDNGAATINLGQQGQLELGPNSELILNVATGAVRGNLRTGQITTHLATGVAVNVATADATVSTDGTTATNMQVDVNCGNTRVSSAVNDVKVTASGKTEMVAAGKEATAGAPQNNRCPRIAIGGAGGAGAAGGALSGGMLAALLIAGIGGAVASVVAITQGDNINSSTLNISNFRP